MKKKLLFLFVALTSLLASADNYFTVGVNDSLRINPNYLGCTVTVPIRTHLDGRIDYWYTQLLYHKPYGLEITASSRGPGMDVHYLDYLGRDTVFEANLNYLRTDTTINVFFSQITVMGFWDWNNDGIYEPYGTAKWEAGEYDCMFNVCFDIEPFFRLDTLTFDYELHSSGDLRGGDIPSYKSIKRAIVYVGLMRGDVDGNEVVGMGDLSALANYLLTNEGLSEFQLSAADLNDDGVVNMYDMSILINLLLTE